MTVTTDPIDAIKAAATDQDALAMLALSDCVAAFVGFACDGRTRQQSIRLLQNWQCVFERNTRRPHDHDRP